MVVRVPGKGLGLDGNSWMLEGGSWKRDGWLIVVVIGDCRVGFWSSSSESDASVNWESVMVVEIVLIGRVSRRCKCEMRLGGISMSK